MQLFYGSITGKTRRGLLVGNVPGEIIDECGYSLDSTYMMLTYCN
jgi:hypothetical protein